MKNQNIQSASVVVEKEEEREGSAGGLGRVLVEGPAAILGPTQAGDLVFLQGELVVVRDLLIDADGLLGVDDDLLLRLDGDDLGVAVGLRGGGGDWVRGQGVRSLTGVGDGGGSPCSSG